MLKKTSNISILSDGLECLIKFDWVQKLNAIKLLHKFLGSIVFNCRTVRVVSSDLIVHLEYSAKCSVCVGRWHLIC